MAAKTEWDDVITWWTGKTDWHERIKTDHAEPWVDRLQAVRDRQPACPGESRLTKMTADVSTPIFQDTRYFSGVAKRAMEALIETDETSEMGAHLTSAINALNEAHERPIINEM